MKLKLSYLFLLVFVVFGIYLRCFHLDFPSIGYHNMKENEYLSIAYHYYDGPSSFFDYFRRESFLCNWQTDNCYFEEYPQMPIIPWMMFLFWEVFGVNLWLPRLIIVLFSVLTIPLIYFLVKELSDNEYLSLVSSFIFSFLPLAVFFGRNLQPETPALFFLVFGLLFGVRWCKNPNLQDAVLAGVGFCFSALLKPTFLIGAIALMPLIPFSRVKDKTVWKQVGVIALIMFFFVVWNFWISTALNVNESLFGGTLNRVDLFRPFTGKYWNEYYETIKAYTADNYAGWYLWFAVLGFVMMLFKWSRLSRFCLGYLFALVPYLMILADYFKAHSYYQMPFLPLVCICSGYFIFFIGQVIRAVVKIRFLQYASILLLIPTMSAVELHTNAQWNTVFFGLDVAGDYINKHVPEQNWIFVNGHAQSFGACFASKRGCTGVMSNLTQFKLSEERHNISLIYLHSVGIPQTQSYPEVWQYISENYHLAHAGFVKQGDQPQVQYLILVKPGPLDMNALNSRSARLAGNYDLKNGNVDFFVVEE